MQLSLKLILEELQFQLEAELVPNPSFTSAELYILGGSDLSGDTLLIAPLTEALLVPKTPGLYFLCIRDRMVDGLETDEIMEGICVVRKNLELRELFNAVQRVFVRMQSWVTSMHQSVIQGRGLQDLMSLSEPIIGNHIAVMDAAFRLMAYTRVETDDEISNNLMRYGYHPEETVKYFRKTRRIEQFETADDNGIIVSDDHVTSDYTVVKKVYKYDNTYFMIVVMVCCSRRYSEGLMQLFQLLLENIRYYVEREYPSVGGRSPTESLLCELIDKTLHQEEEARKRASSVGLPFEGNFDLCLFVCGDTLNTPVNRAVRELSTALADSRVVLHGRDILVLNLNTEGAGEDHLSRRLDTIWSLTGEQFSCCGTSNPFTSLWDLSTAYNQARAAVTAGDRLRTVRGIESTPQSNYTYEEYYLYHLMEYCAQTIPDVVSGSFAFDALRTLRDYDHKHKAKTLHLLHTYLKCERSASDTCALLHMHRNTVLYHIGKIEDLLGVSLDDCDTRLKLLMGFKALELGRV